MRYNYETRCRAFDDAPGKAGYGGTDHATTNARTTDGIIKAMYVQAQKSLDRRVAFYNDNPVARKFDVFDEPHVWTFNAWGDKNGVRLHVFAWAIKGKNGYSPVEYEWTDGRDNWQAFKSARDFCDSVRG